MVLLIQETNLKVFQDSQFLLQEYKCLQELLISKGWQEVRIEGVILLHLWKNATSPIASGLETRWRHNNINRQHSFTNIYGCHASFVSFTKAKRISMSIV